MDLNTKKIAARGGLFLLFIAFILSPDTPVFAKSKFEDCNIEKCRQKLLEMNKYELLAELDEVEGVFTNNKTFAGRRERGCIFLKKRIKDQLKEHRIITGQIQEMVEKGQIKGKNDSDGKVYLYKTSGSGLNEEFVPCDAFSTSDLKNLCNAPH